MTDRPVLAPRCPGCDAAPVATWFLPYFCSDVECPVICWNPHEPPEQFKATAVQLDLSFLEGP